VAERERPGRLDGLDNQLLLDIESEFGMRFAVGSAVIPHGRVSATMALAEARKLIYSDKVPQVVITASDSLLTWPTLSVYDRAGRLLTPTNSNGFMPGEAGAALLVGRPGDTTEVRCTGIGFGREQTNIDSDRPLRADGLAAAIRAALSEAGCGMHHLDYRITDLSGEQYYFKEASLAVSRILRKRRPCLDLWHPAESIGEAGAAVGLVIAATASAAWQKAYSVGPDILVHMGNDGGQRAAAILRCSGHG
jgi:3-oxoacyl-[acyl-carrier-protein] synthase-1